MSTEWTEETVRPHMFTEVEVSDTTFGWIPAKMIGYDIKRMNPFEVIPSFGKKRLWIHMRPIPKEEPTGKPSWDNAPEWAQWLAQDIYGHWTWFEIKPVSQGKMWFSIDDDARSKNAGRARSNHDWKNTLEQRPKEEPKPEMIPLGPEDVRCGDEVRRTDGWSPDAVGCIIWYYSKGFIQSGGQDTVTWDKAQVSFKIRRQGTDEWVKMEKEATISKTEIVWAGR